MLVLDDLEVEESLSLEMRMEREGHRLKLEFLILEGGHRLAIEG